MSAEFCNFVAENMEKVMNKKFEAALFDLDGVILDTEGQYGKFWGSIGREYRPDVPDMAQRIKGQTLRQIFDAWITDTDDQEVITQRLDQFEADMDYPYIKGIQAYAQRLRREGVKSAIVTSSNHAKMESVYRKKPELKAYFDCILTSEDFTESKPSPQCYLRAAEVLGVPIENCVVFEDSINGLRSGRSSGAYVVGLATTNPREVIIPLCDKVIDDFACLATQTMPEENP